METFSDKKVSKIYRKMLTSNEPKAIFIYDELNDDLKTTIKGLLNKNGSRRARNLLERLQ